MGHANTAPAVLAGGPKGTTGAQKYHGDCSTDLAAEVRAAHARGWALTPLSGKRPTRPGWQREAPLPLADLLRHVKAGGNIGLRTGAVSGLLVVDFDDCDALPPGTPRTATVRTARGWHVYLRHIEGVGNRAGLRIGGCKADLRGDGGQVVLPGSTHPDTGLVYEWHTRPEDAPLADIPPAWLAVIAETPAPPVAGPAAPVLVADRYGAAALRAEAEAVRTAPEGVRNHLLNRSAYKVAGLIECGYLSAAEIREALAPAAREAGLPDFEIRATLENAIRAGAARPRAIGGRAHG